MMLGRAFDRKCLSLQRQGRLGTFAPIFGQEATLVGVAMALDPARDWAVPQYRELPVQIRQGVPLETVAIYRRGHPDGGIVPEGVRMFATQVSLAAQLPHAVGLAWGMKMKGEDGAVAVFFGDGASSEGDFHESCNLAGVVDAPVLFVLQNNQWAISTPRSIQTAGADLASRAPAYGFPGVSVDGNDLFAVHAVAADAVARARAGKGATADRGAHLPHGHAHHRRRSRPLHRFRRARTLEKARSHRPRTEISRRRGALERRHRRGTGGRRRRRGRTRLRRRRLAPGARPGGDLRTCVRCADPHPRPPAAPRIRASAGKAEGLAADAPHEHGRGDPRRPSARRWSATTACC